MRYYQDLVNQNHHFERVISSPDLQLQAEDSIIMQQLREEHQQVLNNISELE